MEEEPRSIVRKWFKVSFWLMFQKCSSIGDGDIMKPWRYVVPIIYVAPIIMLCILMLILTIIPTRISIAIEADVNEREGNRLNFTSIPDLLKDSYMVELSESTPSTTFKIVPKNASFVEIHFSRDNSSRISPTYAFFAFGGI